MPLFPLICEESFNIISASILAARNEISAEMVMNGHRVCIEQSESKFRQGDRMNAISVGYVSFSMHTHPLIAYCSALCNIGYPSGDDMRAWFSEAVKNNGIPTIHYCCTIEGTYIVRVRPLRLFQGFNVNSFKSKIFNFFAAYHNARSTEDTNSESISPTQWVDICNTVTPIIIDKDLEGKPPDPNYYKTLFDCWFIPHVVEFGGQKYCGDLGAKCTGTVNKHKSFWEAYEGEKVEQVCRRADEGYQDSALASVQLDENGIYTTDRSRECGKGDDAAKRYYKSRMSTDDYEDLIFEYEMYERIFAVVKAKSKLADLLQEGSNDLEGPVVSMLMDLKPFDVSKISTISDAALLLEKLSNNSLNQAYKNILIGQWFFSTSRMSTWVVREDGVASIFKVNQDKDEVMQNSARRLHYIKKKIKQMVGMMQSRKDSEVFEVEEMNTSKSLTKREVESQKKEQIERKEILTKAVRKFVHHHSRDFKVYEMPKTAPFVNGNSYVMKDTEHDGLNRPERVSYNFDKDRTCAGIFTEKGNWRHCDTDCQSKTVFLNLHKYNTGFQDLVIHELVHSALNDNIYFNAGNHTHPFDYVEKHLKLFCEKNEILFYQEANEPLVQPGIYVYRLEDSKLRTSLETSMRGFSMRA